MKQTESFLCLVPTQSYKLLQVWQFTTDFHESSLNVQVGVYITYVQIISLNFKLFVLKIDSEQTWEFFGAFNLLL